VRFARLISDLYWSKPIRGSRSPLRQWFPFFILENPLETITKPTPPVTVRASVNEKKLFASMKHLFASSFSVVSELMQNARRAGATAVHIGFDPVAKTLGVKDDGCGIEDFSALIALCDSSWGEQVTITDKPFGMGLFSTFFACEKVIFRSKGKVLEVSLDDVVNKRELKVVTEGLAEKGTEITLVGLSQELMAQCDVGMHMSLRSAPPKYKMAQRIAEFAMGFPIPVVLNGEGLPRPHAVDSLRVTQTQFGAVSMAHVHDERDIDVLFSGSFTYRKLPAYYLQGLPIQCANSIEAGYVVHLNGQMFTPLMPDRKTLYDGAEQLNALTAEVKRLAGVFLAEQKARLQPVEFLDKYFEACEKFKVAHLLNDIPALPSRLFTTVYSLDKVEQYRGTHTNGTHVTPEMLSSGQVTAWRDEPDSCTDSSESGAILRVMHDKDIFAFNRSELDEGHWVFELVPSCLDFNTKIVPLNVIAEGFDHIDNRNVRIVLVDQFSISITSEVDETLKLEHVFNDSWAIEFDAENEDDYQESLTCFLAKEDKSDTHPVDAISEFEDDNNDHREDWADNARDSWNAIVAGLSGSTLCETISRSVQGLGLPLSKAHIGQLVLAKGAKRDNGYVYLSVVDLEDEKVWKELSKLVKKGVSKPSDLKEMFIQAACKAEKA